MAKETNILESILFKLDKCHSSIIKLNKTIKTLNEQRTYLKNKAKIVSFVEYIKIIQELKDAKIKLSEINKENERLNAIKESHEKNPNQKP